MAESKSFLDKVPVEAWVALAGLFFAKGVWGDLTEGAKELGKNTKEALEEVQRSKQWLLNLPEFKPGYFSRFPKNTTVHLLTASDRLAKAKGIYNSKGFFNDNEARLWTILNSITYKTQLAVIAEAFLQQYKQSLGAYLDTFLNTNERHNLELWYSKLK